MTQTDRNRRGAQRRPSPYPATPDRIRRPAAPPEMEPAPPTPEQRRAAARRARELRRRRRRLAFWGAVAGILVVSGVITLLLPTDPQAASTEAAPVAPPSTRLVAPLPYGGAEGGGASAVPAVDWGRVGPARQEGPDYTYTAAPAAEAALPEFGRVELTWFSDAAFLGDSLTAGFAEYQINLDGARICAYTGASPNQVVNRTTLTNPQGEEEIPLEVLSAAQPKKLYLLMGTNALAGGATDDGFLAYYNSMLDELKAALPNTMIFVQSLLPVRPEAAANYPGLESARLQSVNSALAGLCAEKGLYFLDLSAEFSDAEGALLADYAENDGIHLTVSGYRKWVNFLCSHAPYDRHNPYQPGSAYYLDDTLRSLLADLP